MSRIFVLDVYQGEDLIATGTVKELKKILGVSESAISVWKRKGYSTENYGFADDEYFALINEDETDKVYPAWRDYEKRKVYGLGQKKKRGYNIDEIEDLKKRKSETKEMRRLRRNVRAKMIVEALHEEEFG